MENFELPDGSYSVSDIQDYFEYIVKRHEDKTVNPSRRIYVSKNEYRITFKTKTGFYLELLTPETMKLLENTKSKTTKDEDGEHDPHLKISEVVLVYCNIFTNNYQQNSAVLYTYILNKLFGQLLDISPENFIFLKILNTDQNSKPLEKEHKINITLVIN